MSEHRRIGELIAAASRTATFHVIAGTLFGVLIIVVAVALSTLIFHAYGWGLFVLTPFVVGFTTAFVANRQNMQSGTATTRLVLMSAALGCSGLILLGIEGLICLILAAPLAVGLAIGGGSLGRRAARIGKDPTDSLYCIALLPVMFAADAAFPPAITMLTSESVIIDASAPRVWGVVTSGEPIRERATLAGRLGLAYPERATFSGSGVGAIRTGYFSTGEAREQVTDWEENRLLAFMVLTQPPAMKEMSPYREVRAPHLVGYFETGETQFELEPIGTSRTRLTIRAAHRLRIDPVVYWEPIARWAVSSNTRRVLRDMKSKAEGNG